jgi:hypothetical protein
MVSELYWDKMTERELIQYCWDRSEKKGHPFYVKTIERLATISGQGSEHIGNNYFYGGKFTELDERLVKDTCILAREKLDEKEKLNVLGTLG